MRTVLRHMAGCLALAGSLTLPTTSDAQVWIGAAGPRPGSVEVSAGGVWSAATDFGSQAATLTPNVGSSFQLFETESRLGQALGAQGTLAFHVTRALAVEGGFQYARPQFEVRIFDDFEDAPDVTAATTITQYLITGSLVYHFGRAGRTTPFVAAGAGYIRDVHEGNAVIETGTEYHGKAGVKLWFGRRQNSALRLEGGVSVRDGGFSPDAEERRLVPTAAASFAYRF